MHATCLRSQIKSLADDCIKPAFRRSINNNTNNNNINNNNDDNNNNNNNNNKNNDNNNTFTVARVTSHVIRTLLLLSQTKGLLKDPAGKHHLLIQQNLLKLVVWTIS